MGRVVVFTNLTLGGCRNLERACPPRELTVARPIEQRRGQAYRRGMSRLFVPRPNPRRRRNRPVPLGSPFDKRSQQP